MKAKEGFPREAERRNASGKNRTVSRRINTATCSIAMMTQLLAFDSHCRCSHSNVDVAAHIEMADNTTR